MPRIGRRHMLAGVALLIGLLVAYFVDPRAGLIVLILLLGIIILA